MPLLVFTDAQFQSIALRSLVKTSPLQALFVEERFFRRSWHQLHERSAMLQVALELPVALLLPHSLLCSAAVSLLASNECVPHALLICGKATCSFKQSWDTYPFSCTSFAAKAARRQRLRRPLLGSHGHGVACVSAFGRWHLCLQSRFSPLPR